MPSCLRLKASFAGFSLDLVGIFFVLPVSMLFLRIFGMAGVSPFESWTWCLRSGLALLFLYTASAHWGKRRGSTQPQRHARNEALIIASFIPVHALARWINSVGCFRRVSNTSTPASIRRNVVSIDSTVRVRPASIWRLASATASCLPLMRSSDAPLSHRAALASACRVRSPTASAAIDEHLDRLPIRSSQRAATE